MGIKNVQNEAENLPKWTPNRVPDGPPQVKISKKNLLKKAMQQKRAGLAFHRAPRFEPKKWPTWLHVGLQNQSKIDKKSMQKSIVFLMPLGIDFWVDFGGFGEAKSSQVGTKIDKKSMPIAKCNFLKNRALAAAGARFLRFWGSKLGVKID